MPELQMSDKNKSKKVCFVIGPIGDPGTDVRRDADWLLRGIINPVFAKHFHDQFEVPIRADAIVEPGIIHTQVIRKLLEAELVIADLSRHNANAFYELAIRHAIRLPTIHMIHKDWKLPFDVAPHRAITFGRDEHAELEKAQADLKSTVEEVTKEGFVVENPITHARGVINLDQHASPEQRVLLDRLEALERQVRGFRRGDIIVDHGRPVAVTAQGARALESVAEGERALEAALAARGETWEGFVNRKLAENLSREEFSSVKKSNE
jgi:hypothetical protein